MFDLASDPEETVNLADDPAHAATLERLTKALQAIIPQDILDVGYRTENTAKNLYAG